MTPSPDNALAYIYSPRERKRWIRQWWEEGRKYQSLLWFNKFEEPLKEGDHIIVTNHLFADIRDGKLSIKDRKSRGITLIDEYITDESCIKLSIVLDHIRISQCIGYCDAIAHLILFHTWYIDTRRACKEKKPILFSGRADQDNAFDVPRISGDYVEISDVDLNSDHTRAATWSIRQLVNFWNALGGKFAKGLSTERHKRWFYQMIPPVKLFSDELKEIYKRNGQTYEPIKARLEDDIEYIVKAEDYLETVRDANKRGYDIDFTTPNSRSRSMHIKEVDCSDLSSRIVGKQQDVPPSIFTHSDDYTYVCVRGQPFTLTSKQAQAVQFMHEHYQSGIPELSQARILTEVNMKSSRLHDLFRSTPEAWRTLIIPGSRRGMYRLNIFD